LNTTKGSTGLTPGDEAAPGAREGAVVGALGGLVLAVQDLAGTFLVSPPELRAEVFLRVLATTAPVGAVVGATIAFLVAATRRRLGTPRVRLLETVPLVVLASPAVATVAWLLFSGGAMSRLAHRPALSGAAFVALLAMLSLTLAGGAAVAGWARASWLRRGLTAGLFIPMSFGVARADQYLFPGLYDYLHGCLTAIAFGAACLAVAPLVHRFRPRTRTGPLLLFTLAATMMVNLSTLDASATVRSELFDPRASHVRSLLLALEPMLSPAARVPPGAVARARAARARRERARDSTDLPSWEGAHVLLITIDALRPDHLGLNGYDRPTSPTLDRLAEESVVFERAYAQAPHSSYSLSSLMTSEYLHEVVEARGTLPEATLASALSAASYRTSALFPLGIFHTEGEHLTGYSDSRFRFTHTDTRDLDARERTDAAIEELDEVVRSGEPASLTWVHYFDAHEPYRDTHFGTSDIDRYDSEIRRVDHEIERLLAAADEVLTGETIVVVTADHGEEFRDHGGVYHGFTLYEEQVRVPLLIRAPGLAPRRIAAPVELVDVAPTLLEMVAVAPPRSMRGDDLRGLALGRTVDAGPAYAGVGTQRMVVRYPDKLVADLRFSVFRLFDLESDPHERDNRATRAPARLGELRGEIFAWLDDLALPPGEELMNDPAMLALNRGRLGDRRAVPELAELLVDDRWPAAVRGEAARLLGKLGGRGARTALAHGLGSDERSIRVEAAIALGLLRDERGRRPLLAIVTSGPGGGAGVGAESPGPSTTEAPADAPARRARAAIALARLGALEALPELPAAARNAPGRRERNEAIRHLGRLGGPDSLGPLLTLFEDFRTRRPAALALGHLGDRGALAPLLSQLEVEGHANIRDAIVEGLGRLGDPRAIPALTALLSQEPTLGSTSESLIRLDAITEGAVGGSDVGPDSAGLRGFTTCRAAESSDPYRYAGRTECTTNADPAIIPLRIPPAITGAVDGVELVIRLATGADGAPVDVRITLDGQDVGSVHAEGTLREVRRTLPVELLRGAGEFSLSSPVPIRVDHVLLVPRRPTLAHSTASN